MLRITLFITALVTSLNCYSLDLPVAPDGYAWKECPELTCAFLKPANWHYKTMKQGDTHGIFISKEKTVEGGMYETGVMVNIMQNTTKKNGVLPSQWIKSYSGLLVKKNEVTKQWAKDMGPFKSITTLSIHYYKNEPALKEHTVLIANNETGTIYFIKFETLPELWEKYWPVAEPIIRMIYIDSDV